MNSIPREPEDSGASDLKEGRVLIYGLGRSGLATAHLLLSRSIRIAFFDDREVPGYRALSDRIPWPEVPVHFQSLSPEVLLGYELVVVSPGVPAHAPALMTMKAAGLRVISEIELAWRFARAPIVAVTGTNGKTTTCTMIQGLLSGTGTAAIATGNIGYPFTTAVAEKSPGWFVVEVSSFQLHHVDRFRPKIALITSFAPNHLDWHGDEESYLAAKMNVARSLQAEDTVIFPSTTPKVRRALASCPAKKVTFGPRGDLSLDLRRRAITRRVGRRREPYLRLGALARSLPYDYRMVSDAVLATSALAAALDLPATALEEMLTRFRPLKHRIETVATRRGVTFVNDSKSTSVDATIYALARQKHPVVLMLGGRDKGLDFTPIATLPRSRVKAIVAFGEARQKIAGQLGGHIETVQAEGLVEAIDQARKLARTGDVVLFSPACASYDQFKNYEERGEAFRRIVNGLGDGE